MKSPKKIIRRAIEKLMNKTRFSRAYTFEDRERDQEKMLKDERRTSKKAPNPHKKPGDAYLKPTDLDAMLRISLAMYQNNTVNISKIGYNLTSPIHSKNPLLTTPNTERTRAERQIIRLGQGFDFKRAYTEVLRYILNSPEVQSRIRAGQKVYCAIDPTDLPKHFFPENWYNKEEYYANGKMPISRFEAVTKGHVGAGDYEMRARIIVVMLIFEDGTTIPLNFELQDPNLQDVQLMKTEILKIHRHAHFPLHFLCDSAMAKFETIRELQDYGVTQLTTRLTGNVSMVFPETNITQNIEVFHADLIDNYHDLFCKSLSRDINVDDPTKKKIFYKGFEVTLEDSTDYEPVGLYLSTENCAMSENVKKAIAEGSDTLKVPTVAVSIRDMSIGASKSNRVQLHTTLHLSPYTFLQYQKKIEEKKEGMVEKSTKSSQTKREKREGNVSLESYDTPDTRPKFSKSNPFTLRAIGVPKDDSDETKKIEAAAKKKEKEEKEGGGRIFYIVASTSVSGLDAIKAFDMRFSIEVYNKMMKQGSNQSGDGFIDITKFRVLKFKNLQLIVWNAFLISLASAFALLQYGLEALSKMLTLSEAQEKALLKDLLKIKYPLYRLLVEFKKAV